MGNERKGSFILPNGEPYPIHRTIPGESWIKSYNRKFEDETDVIHRKRFTNQCLDDKLGLRSLQWICGPYFYGEIEKILYNELCEEDKQLIELFEE
ncbi:hypothetical protein Avbf_11256 [Armadillidium vulgare]|nr:hypothetical protein Avbf_11256 [Armadillidium vulgare]